MASPLTHHPANAFSNVGSYPFYSAARGGGGVLTGLTSLTGNGRQLRVISFRKETEPMTAVTLVAFLVNVTLIHVINQIFPWSCDAITEFTVISLIIRVVYSGNG